MNLSAHLDVAMSSSSKYSCRILFVPRDFSVTKQATTNLSPLSFLLHLGQNTCHSYRNCNVNTLEKSQTEKDGHRRDMRSAGVPAYNGPAQIKIFGQVFTGRRGGTPFNVSGFTVGKATNFAKPVRVPFFSLPIPADCGALHSLPLG